MGLIERITDGAKRVEHKVDARLGGATTEHRERAIRLNETGVNRPATITAMRETGRTDPGGGKEIEFSVDVDPGTDSYAGVFTQYIVAGELKGAEVRSPIMVRVDPDDRAVMMFWGAG